jgi:lycopene cyclase domain-containing protein
MAALYLSLLLGSLAGLALLDWHRRLAFFADVRRTTALVVVTVAFFLVWDTVGIALGIFARGDVAVMTGVELWPEMPVEEPVFLVLLTYVTLLCWRLLDTGGGSPRPWPGRSARRGAPTLPPPPGAGGRGGAP